MESILDYRNKRDKFLEAFLMVSVQNIMIARVTNVNYCNVLRIRMSWWRDREAWGRGWSMSG